MEQKITRTLNFEMGTEEVEKKGRITGRPIVYNSLTDIGYFWEQIAPGALDHTDLRDVRLLINHDTSRIPLARSRRNNENSTMQLIPVVEGMDFRADIDIDNNAEARALYSAIERGDISGMSFMFVIDGEEWTDLDTDKPTRTITSISKVYEISAVTFPAYEDTSINIQRSLDNEALESARATLEREKEAKRQLELAKAKLRLQLQLER
ncbi:MAG: HK97 family phage prohead protease [Clostridiales bacterium]|nr:HK97 family phage prohead protease [Clostridiales bacterium]